jgi:hypothetical protein
VSYPITTIFFSAILIERKEIDVGKRHVEMWFRGRVTAFLFRTNANMRQAQAVATFKVTRQAEPRAELLYGGTILLIPFRQHMDAISYLCEIIN